MHRRVLTASSMCMLFAIGLAGCVDDPGRAVSCAEVLGADLRDIAPARDSRFLGKVEAPHARCLGGERAVSRMRQPWVDWSNYWATGDAESRSPFALRDKLGVDGALYDLEYQRMELIKFNLFDNSGTFQRYLAGDVVGGQAVPGPTLRVWPEMRLPVGHPSIGQTVVAADGSQLCVGEAIRFRTLSGICNDMRNPAMGASGQLFARNVEFESTFPEIATDPLTRNRHGDRLALLRPDPQVISRKLFTRDESGAADCNQGFGAGGAKSAECPYKPAPFFNVLAAYWIQFMTHDWFSHLNDARNDQSNVMVNLGCAEQRVDNLPRPLTPQDIARLGCRPEDKMEAGLVAQPGDPGSFIHDGRERLKRAHKTTRNNVTAWWDASQIYGHDDTSLRRVRRDPNDPAKLLLDGSGYLPPFRLPCGAGSGPASCDPIRLEWVGQEAVAFPDNWSIGLSFLHTLFVREHNSIVEAFRRRAAREPDTDSGLRDPAAPERPIVYAQIGDEVLFQVARLIVAAEIAKIHTIEWTTQLLYDEPLHLGMNSNWSGLFEDKPVVSAVMARIVERLGKKSDPTHANLLYSAFAAGPGIVGLGSDGPDVNGGINHFGSPFNFPEEFTTVYRLHPLLPDLLEYRDLRGDPNRIGEKVAVIDTFRGRSTAMMRQRGMANWGLSMGRQRLGALALRNHPRFLQNLALPPRLDTKIDVAALDIIRDRERGVPRFNEFRRQIGLRQLTSFDDFIDRRPGVSAKDKQEQVDLVATLREVYGQHVCDDSKPITSAQRDPEGRPVTDCLGHADGSLVDNIEDLDVVVGMLAESTRPHGFAISETQFHIFILNASRRLFGDRFFTSSFRPAFYTSFGIDWVNDNGPDGKVWEQGMPNGHRQEVLPLKRLLLRNIPELKDELRGVVNAFDPWARDRGEYYSLQWKPRPEAATDEAFAKP